MVSGTGSENEIMTTTLTPTEILEPRHKSRFDLIIASMQGYYRSIFSEFSFYPISLNWFKE